MGPRWGPRARQREKNFSQRSAKASSAMSCAEAGARSSARVRIKCTEERSIKRASYSYVYAAAQYACANACIQLVPGLTRFRWVKYWLAFTA